jgi:hypothetical protein
LAAALIDAPLRCASSTEITVAAAQYKSATEVDAEVAKVRPASRVPKPLGSVQQDGSPPCSRIERRTAASNRSSESIVSMSRTRGAQIRVHVTARRERF